MKKIIILCLAAVLLSACDNDSSSSDDDFKLLPYKVDSFSSPDTSYNTNLGISGLTGKAVIFTKKINGTYYTGIALSDDPASETFALKIYFTGYSSIPTGTITVTAAANNLKIMHNNSDITNNLTLTISLNSSTSSYKTYLITGSGTGSLSTITSIIAVKV